MSKTKLLIATHNFEKFKRYEKLLLNFSQLELVSLRDLEIKDVVEENFESNLENAKHKAKCYALLSRLPTIAVDEAVVTNFLPKNQQPGVYVRRFAKDKKELSDEEVVEIWKEIFAQYPEKEKKFIWNFAIAFYDSVHRFEDNIRVKQISYAAKKFSKKNSNGYPMSRVLSPEPDSLSYSDTSEEKKDFYEKKIFAPFLEKMKDWMDVISKK